MLVVGASGGCFGLMGLFIADLVLNFETVTRPILRSIMIFAFLCFFIYTILTQVRMCCAGSTGVTMILCMRTNDRQVSFNEPLPAAS